MSHSLDLELLDIDGAVRESAEAAGFDRSDFLKKGVLAGGGLIAGSALLSQFNVAEAVISKKKSKRNDVKILNYALTLEFLEAAFYKQAVANNAAGNNVALKRFAEVVAVHEAKHVSFLRKALGSAAIKSPTFDFGKAVTDQATFAATAQVLEDTGVTAYLGQVANIFQGAILAAAGTIATVEARHAAWIRFINKPAIPGVATKDLPAPMTFDLRKSEATVLRAVQGTGFVKS
ncbi:MAG: ferritin-like domain-containing protein [Actinobacteria bacterium]|nr:ferritin-like domain-containing protein [Actinomycetota bacterium]